MVQMLTDDQGNDCLDQAEAHRGDAIRFTLKTGAHDVYSVADSNGATTGLPDMPGDFLKLPGQTYDVNVAISPGRYLFQCDPHALLGVVGHVKVEAES